MVWDGRSYGNSCCKAILGVQVSALLLCFGASIFALSIASDQHICSVLYTLVEPSFNKDCGNGLEWA